MNEMSRPEVDQWYEDAQGRTFQVVALDEGEGVVEVQYFDGEVEELDLADWADLEPRVVAPPEDWTGPYDDLEADDLGDTEVPPGARGANVDELDL